MLQLLPILPHLPFFPSSLQAVSRIFHQLPHHLISYQTVKMSAIIPEDGEAPVEQIKVLFTLHPGMDALDFIGPLEVLTHAQHNPKDSGMQQPYSDYTSVC